MLFDRPVVNLTQHVVADADDTAISRYGVARAVVNVSTCYNRIMSMSVCVAILLRTL